MRNSKCPKCGRSMTNTTPVKAYCMKCDILIHVPSGVSYTGNPEEDKFVGSPAFPILFLAEHAGKDFEATLAPDALVLTWREGKEPKIERIPYSTISQVEIGERRQSEVSSYDSLIGSVLAGGLWTAAESYLTNVRTLKMKAQQKDYEIWVPEAPKWAHKIRQAGGL